MSFGASGNTISISATGTSKVVAWPVGAISCRGVNTSTTLSVFVQFGTDSATAVIPTADSSGGAFCTPIPPMGQATIDVPKGANFVAVIGSGAGPTLTYLTPGSEG